TGTSWSDVTVTGSPLTFDVNGEQVSLAVGSHDADAVASAINTQVGTDAGVNATVDGSGNLDVTSTETAGGADEVTIGNFSTGDATDLGFASAAVSETGSDETTTGGTTTNVAKTTDELVSEINNDPDLKGKIRASNDNGNLRIENLSTG